MERLTERTVDGILVKENYEKETLKTLHSCYGEKPNPHYTNCEEGYYAMEKLADYEDLEEQGRLIKLPCKVGDTIYAVGEIVKEYKVLSVSYHSNKATNRSEFCIETLPVNGSRVVVAFYDKEFGKNAFLAKPEAEVKLKELRGNQNEV